MAKAEANERGSQRRFVVTGRLGAPPLPEATYAARGERENRFREGKCDPHLDRLRAHRLGANYFRLYPQALALSLRVRVRQRGALPEPEAGPQELPREAAEGEPRRRRDTRGGAQPATWRQRVIKAAVRRTRSSGRVVVHRSGAWPYRERFQQSVQRLLAALAGLPPALQEI